MMKAILVTGALFCALAVIFGAFGAHALKTKLPADMMAIYQTAVQYHFIHALGLLAIGLAATQFGSNTWFTASGIAMLIGIIIFSGSLYTLSLSGIRWLGAITPIGGLGLITAWALFAIGLLKS